MFNANKPTKDILTDVINASNQHNPKFNPYNYGVLRFRNVRPEPDHGNYGASVLVSDDDSVDDRDWLRVFYQKPDISQVIKAGREIPWEPGYTSLEAVLPAINKELGLQLGPSDVVDYKFDFDLVDEERKLHVSIRTPNNGLLFRGMSYVILTGVNPT